MPPVFIVPVPGMNGKQRSSPGCLLVGGIICFVVLIPIGILVLASKPHCGGQAMRVGQECVYRDRATQEIDHTTDYGAEQLSTRLAGLFALTLGSVILFSTVRQYRGHRRRLAQRATVADHRLEAVDNAYTRQIAGAAHAQRQPVEPPPPPQPQPPPGLHHEG